MPIANCAKCSKVFQRTSNPVCVECQQASASQISLVYRFLQNNPRVTLDEIAKYCKMAYKELEEMFLAGKLGTAAHSIIYPCQRCNCPMTATMRRGRFCINCAEKIGSQAGLNYIAVEKTEKPAARTRPPERVLDSNAKPVSECPPQTGSGIPGAPVESPATGLPIVAHLQASSDNNYGFKRVSEG